MASCEPRVSSVRALLVLGTLAATAMPVHAQDRPQHRASPAPTSQEASAPQNASDPLERLKAARSKQTDRNAVRGPIFIPGPTAVDRKRAFEGLRQRAPTTAIDARARAALEKARETMAGEREAAARRIGQALGLEAPDVKAIAGAAATPVKKAWVPVLFASSSMPLATLRTYAAGLERAGGIIAFRGMPGGLAKVAPMAKLSAEILHLDPGCEGPACAMRGVQLIVDPLLFRQHSVARVPALTMVPGDPALPYCEREDDSERGRHLVLGDAALSGLFEEYARLGGKEEVRDAAARIESR